MVGRKAATWVEILGALAAYYGELLRAAAPPPGVAWEVLRCPPSQPFGDEGQIVLARPADASGFTAGWVNPIADLVVLGGKQIREPLAPAERIVGKNDPGRLRWLYDDRLAALVRETGI